MSHAARLILESDPRLNTKRTESPYYPVIHPADGSLSTLKPEYLRISKGNQQSVLFLADEGFPAEAERLANCGHQGTVYAIDLTGKKARAHKHTCHFIVCTYCGKARNRLHCWVRARYPRVAAERQTGIEVVGPAGYDVFRATDLLAKRLNLSAVRHRELTPDGSKMRVRMAVNASDLNYSATLAALRLDSPECALQLYRNTSPQTVLTWAFYEGDTWFGPHLCGFGRAAAWIKGLGRVVRTTGTFYCVAPKNERNSSIFSEEAEQKADPEWRYIPWGERVVDTIEGIEARYEHVDWSSCHDPFHVRRSGSKEVSYRETPTMNFFVAAAALSTIPCATSPPPS